MKYTDDDGTEKDDNTDPSEPPKKDSWVDERGIPTPKGWLLIVCFTIFLVLLILRAANQDDREPCISSCPEDIYIYVP